MILNIYNLRITYGTLFILLKKEKKSINKNCIFTSIQQQQQKSLETENKLSRNPKARTFWNRKPSFHAIQKQEHLEKESLSLPLYKYKKLSKRKRQTSCYLKTRNSQNRNYTIPSIQKTRTSENRRPTLSAIQKQ